MTTETQMDAPDVSNGSASPTATAAQPGDFVELPLDRIEPDPENVRIDRDDPEVDNLAANILQHGLLHPIVVYPLGLGGHYRISGGHRRFKAVEKLGWPTVPASVIETPATALKRLDLMAAENLQRKNLDPIEKGLLFKRYLDKGLKAKDIAERLNVSQGLISQVLSMQDLPDDVQAKVKTREIPWAQAVKLATKHRNENREKPHGTYGRKRTEGTIAPHFNTQHPLHGEASALCVQLAHPTYLWIGGACGRCWESAIRLDEIGEAPTSRPTLSADVERFTQPKDLLDRIRCERCRVPVLSAAQHACYISNGSGEHRTYVKEHLFPLPVQAVAS